MTTDTGGPAFPGLHPSQECRFNDPGMTLRDYFAAKAMQSLVADPDDVHNMKRSEIAVWAYSMADAMLKARDAAQ